ncbi:MAG TPA: YmfQ family protein [Ruminiclostridium sp.]|nr:YmfQ family protein [Ruminiclostridium sp.]
MSKADMLKSYVPEFIAQSKTFSTLYNAQGTEMDYLYNVLDGVLNQCFVDSATWGLKYWEEFLGIPVDESKDTGFRRGVINSKIRGAGTATFKLIQAVAQSYDNGEVVIIENNELYSFTVKFTGTKGIPPNLDDLKAAIEEIKPAHLQVVYEFKYNLWDDVKKLTWSEVRENTWDSLKVR